MGLGWRDQDSRMCLPAVFGCKIVACACIHRTPPTEYPQRKNRTRRNKPFESLYHSDGGHINKTENCWWTHAWGSNLNHKYRTTYRHTTSPLVFIQLTVKLGNVSMSTLRNHRNIIEHHASTCASVAAISPSLFARCSLDNPDENTCLPMRGATLKDIWCVTAAARPHSWKFNAAVRTSAVTCSELNSQRVSGAGWTLTGHHLMLEYHQAKRPTLQYGRRAADRLQFPVVTAKFLWCRRYCAKALIYILREFFC